MEPGAFVALTFSLVSYYHLWPTLASPLNHHDREPVLIARALAPPQSLQDRQTNPFNPVLSSIASLPPINVGFNGATDALASLSELVAPVVGEDIEVRDVEERKPCAAVTIVFAKGTAEGGNMGTFTGPAFVTAVRAALPRVSVNVQGVNYDGTIQGYLDGGSDEGVASMVQLVAQAYNQCPQTQLVMSGYSQGAQITHKSATVLPAVVMRRVAAVVTFGDPKSKTPVANAQYKTLVICHDGDDICDNGDIIKPAHLTYSQDAGLAAAFVAKFVTTRRTVKVASDGPQSLASKA